jgi:hypothetical protein
MTATLEQARSAKDKVLDIVRSNPELNELLVGIGISFVGEGYGVKVNLSGSPVSDQVLPPTMDGVPVHTEIVGEIKPLG